MTEPQAVPKGKSKNRASILIVAVGMLAVLALMAVTFALVSRTELAGSRTLTDRQIAEFAAQQGLAAAVEILSKDDPRFDDFAEPWFTPPVPTNTGSYNGVPTAIPQFSWNRTQANGNRPADNPYHRLVYNDGSRRACYDLNWHINEDPPGDDNGDGYPGIAGIDDDGDGKIDEDYVGRVPGDSGYFGTTNTTSYYDDDEDADQRYCLGLSYPDEDGFTPDYDGRPGAADTDDDHDGQVDEDSNGYADTDGDGLVYEDPGVPDTRTYYFYSAGSWTTRVTYYKDTAYTKYDTTANNVDDDLPMGDMMNNENQGGKSFQPVTDAGRPYGIVCGTRGSWTYTLDGDADGRVWEEGGDSTCPLRQMGTGVAGLKHVDMNLAGAVNLTNNVSNLDDDNSTTDGNYALWTVTGTTGQDANGASIRYDSQTTKFVTYAGGRLGSNRQDDDEDSEGRARTTGGKYTTSYGDMETADGCDADGMILDEGGKINLNCHGSLYDPAFFSTYTGALDGAMKLDSFRVSLVRFFEAYGFNATQSRGFARAIILYRYGPDLKPGRAGVDDDNDHDVPRNGFASLGDVPNRRRLLVRDNGLDDNGNWIGAGNLHDLGLNHPTTQTNLNYNVGYHDGVPNCIRFMPAINPVWSGKLKEPLVDEGRYNNAAEPDESYNTQNVVEGVDDDREFDPVYPRGDDRPYTSIEQMIDAIVWGTTAGRRNPPNNYPTDDSWVTTQSTKTNVVPVASIGQRLGVGYLLDSSGDVVVNVNGDFNVDGDPILDVGDIYGEASRIFSIVREDLSVSVADLDVGKVNINVDLWHSDQMDNDNNGRQDVPQYIGNAYRRGDQSNSLGGIAVTQNTSDGSLYVLRTFSSITYPARPLPGEYDPGLGNFWQVTQNPAEEDTRIATGAQKVARLKRAFRRAFGAASANNCMNADYVDTIMLSYSSGANGRFPLPGHRPTSNPDARSGLLVGSEYQNSLSGLKYAFDLLGTDAYYTIGTAMYLNNPNPNVACLGRVLRDQMWANIVDFEDQDACGDTGYFFPIPTMLACDSNNPNFRPDVMLDYCNRVNIQDIDIFGVEGLHLNEVMLAPGIVGATETTNRSNPQIAIALENPNATADDPVKFNPSGTDPLSLTVNWTGTAPDFQLSVAPISPPDPVHPPPTAVVDVKATGQWRITGIPQGAYVMMAYGSSYGIPATGTEPDGFARNGAALEVIFPANDPNNTAEGGRNGVVVLTTYPSPTNDYTNQVPYHGIDPTNIRQFRKFFARVKDLCPTPVNSNNMKDENNEDFGFVTRPDIMDDSARWFPNPARQFMAFRVDADPAVGFIVRVRATSHWDPTNPSNNQFAHFSGLRLICPFVELVNISKRPIPLMMSPPPPNPSYQSNWSNYPAFRLVMRATTPAVVDRTNDFFADTALYDTRIPTPQIAPGFYMGFDWRMGSSAPNAYPTTTLTRQPNWRWPSWFNPKANANQATFYIPAASADGVFPPNYGYYVMALSEAAYAGSFGAAKFKNEANNDVCIADYYATIPYYFVKNVQWGMHWEENYPVQFMEFPSNFQTAPTGPFPMKQIDQIFGLWNRDKGTTDNPLTVWGRREIWPTSIAGRNLPPFQIPMAGGEIDLWAGSSSPRSTKAISRYTLASDPSNATDRYDYCSIEKTAPVVPNISPRWAGFAQFSPVNANDAQFRLGMNAAWLQVDPTKNNFQRQDLASPANILANTLWWRCSQRNQWDYTLNDTTSSTDLPSILGRMRFANWNKNYMYNWDAGGAYYGRKYLYPGHTDDVDTATAFRGTPASFYDQNLMDPIERRMAAENRTVPVVLDDPFPTVGWLAFVHSELGPWKRMAPVLPEERVGENDVGQMFKLCTDFSTAAPPAGGAYFDDNILTRLIGLSGGYSASFALGTPMPETDYSFRPTPFTVCIYPANLTATTGNPQCALRSVPDAARSIAPRNYRATVYPWYSTAPLHIPYTPDWREIATVWPHGRARAKININTASMPVLCAAFSSATAADIIRHRPYRDIMDVCGFSGFLGNEGSSTSSPLETFEFRRRIVPTTCRTTAAPEWARLGPNIPNLRSLRGVSARTSAPSQNAEILRGDPFFTKNAYYTLLSAWPVSGTFSANYQSLAWTPWQYDTLTSAGGRPGPYGVLPQSAPLDFDDSGAGYMADDLADDVGERMEWFNRYWNIIDIKSRYFTVVTRGRVFSPAGMLAEARLRAIVERQDIVNNLNAPPFTGSASGLGAATAGTDGITDGIKVRAARYVTEY